MNLQTNVPDRAVGGSVLQNYLRLIEVGMNMFGEEGCK